MAEQKIHPSVTSERVMAALERYETNLDNPGFCLSCGCDAEGVEPDARNYTCDHCDEPQVFGAEEVLMMITV